jgi:hypothetical protein
MASRSYEQAAHPWRNALRDGDQGDVDTGEGKVFDPSKTVPLKPGVL